MRLILTGEGSGHGCQDNVAAATDPRWPKLVCAAGPSGKSGMECPWGARAICRSQQLSSSYVVMQETLFPLEFFIQGTPRSLQASSRSKTLWMDQVSQIARIRVQETVDWTFLDDRALSVTIFYFSPARMEGDVDNIVKPIIDAMINVAYLDDQAVEKVLVQKFEPEVERTFADVSLQLAATLDSKLPVVYVRVDDDLAWRSL